jgi:hypothetical protein
MLLNKEILTGLYGGGKTNIVFNISWNTNSVTITAYDPKVNENDRPRINTWKNDGTYAVYMSAGNQVFDFTTKTFSNPWGDRTTGTEIVTIPLRTSQSGGVDFFTDDRLPVPFLVPDISQWIITSTGNPNEKKYQYAVNRFANPSQNVSVDVRRSGLWAFNYSVNTSLVNFSVSAGSSTIKINWGDNSTYDSIASQGVISHNYNI